MCVCVYPPLSAAHGLQHTHGSSGLPFEALTDVVGVRPRAVLKQHLPWLAGPGQVLQVLDLVGGPETPGKPRTGQ